MMTYRTNAAQALHQYRHFPIRPALNEALEAPELDNVEPRLLYSPLFVQKNRYFAVAFHARHRLDYDTGLSRCGVGICHRSSF